MTIHRRFRPMLMAGLATAICLPLAATSLASADNDVGDHFVEWALATESRLEADACTPSGAAPVAATAHTHAGVAAGEVHEVAGAVNAVFYRDEIVVRLDGPFATTAQRNEAISQARRRVIQLAGGPRVIRRTLLTIDAPDGDFDAVTLVYFRLDGRPQGGAAELANRLRTDDQMPLTASPDYIMRPMSHVYLWPNGSPVEASGPEPARTVLLPNGDAIGTGVRVAVLDGGMPPARYLPPTAGDPAAAAILDNVAAMRSVDIERPDITGPAGVPDGVVDYPHAVHAVPIISVLKTIAPGVEIRVGRILDRAGLASDYSAALRTQRMLTDVSTTTDWPDLTIMAFGTPACESRVQGEEYLQPLGLEAVTEMIDTVGDNRLIITSAGNEATDEVYFPAGFNLSQRLRDSIVAVGSIDAGTDDVNPSSWYAASRTGAASSFSNYGRSVDAWAPGQQLATMHADGLTWETETGDLVELHGWALVDGSSFSNPYVAGVIAHQMSLSGQNPERSWNRIRSRGVAPEAPCDDPTLDPGPGVSVTLRWSGAAPASRPSPTASVDCTKLP